MLPVQRDRLDRLMAERTAWPVATWRQRYLDHPLVGALARNLIWTVDGRTFLPAASGAIERPIRQAFINGIIPSEQRATVLSLDSFMSSVGGFVAQPVLGRVADVSGYAASYVVSAAISALALPFVFLARRERAASDPVGVASEPTPG